MSHVISYAINHTVAPRRTFAGLVELAKELGLDQVEIRNDLDGVPIHDGTPAARIREQAEAAGVRILAINALQRFNDVHFRPSGSERQAKLREALSGLAPILDEAGVLGLVEPLGFEESSLRLKVDAVEAIDDLDLGDSFRLLHDTFHHYLSGEPRMYPEHTGLVHISGVDDVGLPLERIRDAHRVLVDANDRCETLLQVLALMEGCDGPYSFEPFAPSVHATTDIAGALETSMHWIDREIARLPA